MNLGALKQQVAESVTEHSKLQNLDGFYYNVGVALAIGFASAAPFFVDHFPLAAKILSASAAFIITIDRALHFGERWIYHRQMRHEYLLILARIEMVENAGNQFSEDEAKKYFMLIFDDLFALRKRETSIPGVSAIKKD